MSGGTAQLTVIVTSFRDPASVIPTLDSLRGQTLDAHQYEVLLVVNGPASADLTVYQHYQRIHPGLAMRIVTMAAQGLVSAHQAGIEAANTAWLTFVDDDDTVSPRFLEAMLATAGPGIVPVALVHHVMADGTTIPDTYITEALGPAQGATARGSRRRTALSFGVAKLIPTEWARSISVPAELQTGWDVVFYATLHAQRRFRVVVVPEHWQAFYFAHLTENSTSRPIHQRTVAATRHAVAEALRTLLTTAPRRRRGLIRGQVRTVTAKVSRILEENPDITAPHGWTVPKRGVLVTSGRWVRRSAGRLRRRAP